MEGESIPDTLAAGPPAPPGAAATRSLRFAGSDSGFQSELDAHVQDRLRIVTGFLAVAVAALFAVARIAWALTHEEGFVWDLGDASIQIHLAGCAVAMACYGILRGRRLSRAALLAMDAFVALAAVATSALVYRYSYESGSPQDPSLLGLLLIARAVVVPGRPLRTLLLSLPALPAYLAVQLQYGAAFSYGGQPLLDEAFAPTLVWSQAVLGLSVAVATLASRVNFALRVRAWEAKQVDRYTLEERIGMGGMGEVYRARHGLLRRPTAIKVLRPDIAGERSLARFEQEVRQTARLTHPNTITIFDYGTTDDGDFYYAMELLDGSDLDRIVREAGPFPPGRVLHVLDQACGALAEAHGIGLVHRDLKPANLVLCRRGGEADVLKVMDFGLVKDLRDGGGAAADEGIAGTPLTMSPEMILREPVTPTSDLYSLGAVGCYLLTGRPLFDAPTVGAFLACHVSEEPVAPSSRTAGVPKDLEEILLRCLRKEPARRPWSAEALRDELRRCADRGRWTPEDARRWWAEHGARFGRDTA